MVMSKGGNRTRIGAVQDGSWLTRERVIRVAAISALGGAGMLAFFWFARHGTVDRFGTPVGSDFTAFWNAGRIALQGQAAAAWDQQLLNDQVRAFHGVDYGTAWIYPPVFLLIATALAALPYLPALLLWQLVSFAAIAATLRRILGNWRDAAIGLASPLTPMVLGHGQNSFITAALIGSGLLAMDRRPAATGAAFGALVYKPQLALVLGPMLVLQRAWRTIGAAALTAGLLVALSILVFGADSWAAFRASLGYGRFYMEQGSVGFHKSAALFAAVRLWGGSVAAAYALQGTGLALALALLWFTRNAAPNVRAAAVCAAAALSTPYLLDYDMAVVGIGAAFLYVEARRTEFLSYEATILALIWAAPWFSRPAAEYLLLPLGPPAMLLLAWLAWRRRGPTASPSRH